MDARAYYPTTYFLRGLDAAGNEVFYTGGAGAGWVSPNALDAFTWDTWAAASRRAQAFNLNTDLHGVWFLARPTDAPALMVQPREVR